MVTAPDVSRLLAALREGEPGAFDRLIPLVYNELRRLAHARLRDERAGHTLNTTGLVHEAYLRLADLHRIQWEDRTHFFAIASRMMRRILVDHAEKRRAQKRGGGAAHVPMNEELLVTEEHAGILLELNDFLDRLEAVHPRQCSVLEHCYFGGLTNEETAELLGVSERTVERDLRFARAWLTRMYL